MNRTVIFSLDPPRTKLPASNEDCYDDWNNDMGEVVVIDDDEVVV